MADNLLQAQSDPPQQPSQDPWEAVGNVIHDQNGGNMANEFTTSFHNLVRQYRPDLAAGKSVSELRAMRSDPDLSRQLTARNAQMNAQLLRHSGVPVNVGTLTLSHILGAGTVSNMAQAPRDFNLDDNGFGVGRYVQGNPDLQGISMMDYVKRKHNPDIQKMIEAPTNALGARPPQ